MQQGLTNLSAEPRSQLEKDWIDTLMHMLETLAALRLSQALLSRGLRVRKTHYEDLPDQHTDNDTHTRAGQTNQQGVPSAGSHILVNVLSAVLMPNQYCLYAVQA